MNVESGWWFLGQREYRRKKLYNSRYHVHLFNFNFFRRCCLVNYFMVVLFMLAWCVDGFFNTCLLIMEGPSEESNIQTTQVTPQFGFFNTCLGCIHVLIANKNMIEWWDR